MKNYSRQREEIIKTVKSLKDHPTAEIIYMTAKAKDPGLSRSTVYRNLNLLVKNNILRKISTISGPDRYDANVNSHSYVICKSCGNIYDFEYDFEFENMKKYIKGQTGVDISKNDRIVIEGICDSCKNII